MNSQDLAWVDIALFPDEYKNAIAAAKGRSDSVGMLRLQIKEGAAKYIDEKLAESLVKLDRISITRDGAIIGYNLFNNERPVDEIRDEIDPNLKAKYSDSEYKLTTVSANSDNFESALEKLLL